MIESPLLPPHLQVTYRDADGVELVKVFTRATLECGHMTIIHQWFLAGFCAGEEFPRLVPCEWILAMKGVEPKAAEDPEINASGG